MLSLIGFWHSMRQCLGFVQQHISACSHSLLSIDQDLPCIGAVLFGLLLGLWASLARQAIACEASMLGLSMKGRLALAILGLALVDAGDWSGLKTSGLLCCKLKQHCAVRKEQLITMRSHC
jgi:hypothetical protein